MYKKLLSLVFVSGFCQMQAVEAAALQEAQKNRLAMELFTQCLKVAVITENISEQEMLGAELFGAIGALYYNEDGRLIAIGNYEKVRELVEKGADVNVGGADVKVNGNAKGMTPLMLALMLSAVPEFCDLIIPTLLAHGAVIHFGALVEAVSFRSTNGVLALLKAGVDINGRYLRGYTALMEASHTRNAELVTLLLQKGADRTLKTDFGATAYDLADNDEIRTLLQDAKI